MKIFMKILVSTFVISVLISTLSFESTCTQLQQDVLRLHILANSDDYDDQQMKLQVRDAVLKTVSPLYDSADCKEKAISITKENLGLITDTAKDVVNSYCAKYDVSASVKKQFFDTRYYDDFTLPAGVYDSLTITIGEGSGKNWWCVMYPSLCVGACSKASMKNDLSDEQYRVVTADDIEYKFKIVEYFEKLSLIFN